MATERPVIVRPAGTSWVSLMGGWIAAVGTAALLAPMIGGILAGRPVVAGDLGLAVPVILGLLVAYLIGGYVAGRMAGYNTSWHGMMSAFFGLFILLVALLLVAAAEQGWFAGAGIRPLTDAFPGVAQLELRALGDTLTFGAILGFLITIFAGWLGGLMAPDHYAVTVAQAVPSTERTVTEPRTVEEPAPRRFRLLPALGRKGGERHEHK